MKYWQGRTEYRVSRILRYDDRDTEVVTQTDFIVNTSKEGFGGAELNA